MKRQLTILSFIVISLQSVAQQGSFFDPAQAYNRLLIEKNNGGYTQVSNYRVVGTPFLFGDKNVGDVYSSTEKAFNIMLRYNVYNQQVEFTSTSNPNNPLIKEPGTLDSFKIRKNDIVGLQSNIVFIYGPLLGTKDKNYYQVVSLGPKVNLYKRYTGELGMADGNIVQAELKQFNVVVDYFYTDSSNKNPKKLKVNVGNLKKEFAKMKDITEFLDADLLQTQREFELVKVFNELNL